jgi:hypothetical protein
LTIWQPCIEDDFHLVATHAVARGNVMLGELDHCFRLIQDPDFNWGLLLRSAIAYGCLESIYIFLHLANLVAGIVEYDPPVPQEIIDQYSKIGINRAIYRWLRDLENLIFPLDIPIGLNILQPGIIHFPALALRTNIKEVALDAASHLMNIATSTMKRN